MGEEAHEETFDSRSGYLLAVDAALARARKEICVFDADLKVIDLGGVERAESLSAFLSGGRDRSVRIALHDTEHVERNCPRIMALLVRFSHSFSIRQTPDGLRHLADCFVIVDKSNAVVRFHADYSRGKLLLALPDETLPWCQRFEDIWLESQPALSPTQLGL